MHFLDPTNDYAFKKVFGNENKKELLMSFLNSVLGLEGEKTIREVMLLNPQQAPHIRGAKKTILDIRCRDQGGVEYIIEMQILKQSYFDKRVLYYASKAYTEQLDGGEDYGDLKRVVFLGILNFVFTEGEDYISWHLIHDKKTQNQVIKDLEFSFVELPKFAKREDELCTVAEKWIFFLKHAKELEAVPEVIQEEAIKEAFAIVERVNWTPQELQTYDERTKVFRDELARLHYSFTEGEKRGEEKGIKKGLEKGIKKGLEKGVKKGLEKGKKEGREEEKRVLAEKMLAAGLPIEQITEITGLSVAFLCRLQTKEEKQVNHHEHSSNHVD